MLNLLELVQGKLITLAKEVAMKSQKEIDEYIKLLIQTDKAFQDFSDLSKKKPNDGVNKFKLKLINKLLMKANSILDEQNKPFDDFEQFDEDDVPSNSDVVLILTQYVACLKKFGRDQTIYQNLKHFWLIKGKRSNINADMNLLREVLGK